MLRFGLPVSLIAALATYGNSHRLTWASLISPGFVIYFAVMFILGGVIGGYLWGANRWRKGHED